MGYSKTFLFFGLVFAVVLLISSNVSARELFAEAAQTREFLTFFIFFSVIYMYLSALLFILGALKGAGHFTEQAFLLFTGIIYGNVLLKSLYFKCS